VIAYSNLTILLLFIDTLSIFSLTITTSILSSFFFFNDTATTEIYTLSLHDALPIFGRKVYERHRADLERRHRGRYVLIDVKTERSEEHTSELQSRGHLVCRLLLEKKKKKRENIKNMYEKTKESS